MEVEAVVRVEGDAEQRRGAPGGDELEAQDAQLHRGLLRLGGVDVADGIGEESRQNLRRERAAKARRLVSLFLSCEVENNLRHRHHHNVRPVHTQRGRQLLHRPLAEQRTPLGPRRRVLLAAE